MTALLAESIQRFRDAVAARLGLHFDEARLDLLSEVMRRRIEVTRLGGADEYLRFFESTSGEAGALAEQLTVAETYFFRYWDHFRAFSDTALPACIARPLVPGRLTILSAGCASGEEAYSLAMILKERLPQLGSPRQWRIVGVDINPAMIDKARRARYSPWSLRETPEPYRRRHFTGEGRELTLDPEIRGMVEFEARNLVEADPDFWRPDSFDVVFCRNVMMYLAPWAIQALAARIEGAMTRGGFLFLGHAETLRGISQGFHLRHSHDTFYYQRREAGAPAGPASSTSELPAARGMDRAQAAARFVEASGSWIQAIQAASDRIESLAESSSARGDGAPATAAAAPSRGAEMAVVMELLRSERFSEALDRLGRFPDEWMRDVDAQLLRAVLLANAGRLREAEAACQRILERDEMNAGAHFVMALRREHEGALREAVAHDQTAAYLDETFAMPRLHLGLMAARAGDRDRAARELSAALALLAREDPSRILLFGGGFSRETLSDLCRAKLRAAGGRT
jgi:chemotaxis protein methyltransferase CheR